MRDESRGSKGHHRWVTKEWRGDESKSSAEPNNSRRIATKTSLEESKSDERALAVTTQESSDGIREKAIKIASIEELETGSSTAPRELRMTGQGKPMSL